MADTPGVQQMLGTPPAEITAGGKVWKVGFPTQKAKAVLEELVAQSAREELARFKVPLSEWVDRVQAGHYRTRQAGWKQVMEGASGGALFLLSLLKEHHPDATAADAEGLDRAEPEQVKAAVLRVAPDFLSLLLADLPPAVREAEVARGVAALTGSTS